VTGLPPRLPRPFPAHSSGRPGPGTRSRDASQQGADCRHRDAVPDRLPGVVTATGTPILPDTETPGRLLLIDAADREEAVELARRGTPAKRPRWGAALTTKRDREAVALLLSVMSYIDVARADRGPVPRTGLGSRCRAGMPVDAADERPVGAGLWRPRWQRPRAARKKLRPQARFCLTAGVLPPAEHDHPCQGGSA
jgi:hypothetical protein